RLAHPNVITVYEVGNHGGRRFIAMELVEGETLRAGVAAGERSWRDIVAMFEAAGRGLEAAHRAGLVHRDFKPENVIVGAGGRPRVGDFGLVTTGDNQSFAGTPGYMAPELLDHGIANARSDQFAFAVALHEALHGQRPFPGKTIAEIAANMESGVRTPLRGSVPAWVTAVIERGLALDPTERWPDMGAMLDALRRDPAIRRRRFAIAGVMIASASVAIWSLARPSTVADPCDGVADRVTATWTPVRRVAIAEAFAATKAIYAAPLAGFVTERIDRAATAIAAARIGACRATKTYGEQSDVMLDARMACLDRHLATLASVADVLAKVDRAHLDAAKSSVATLDDVSECANVTELSALPAEPTDPTTRAALTALRERLARLEATSHLLGNNAGAADSEVALAEAKRIGYCPVVASALYLRARLVGDTAANKDAMAASTKLYRDAATMADSCRADRVRATALLALADHLDAVDSAGAQRGDVLAEATGAVARVVDPHLRLSLLHIESDYLTATGQLDLAVAMGESAVLLARSSPGGVTPQLLEDVAITHLRHGTIDRGEELAHEARDRFRAELGPDHPQLAQLAQVLGALRQAHGDPTGAIPIVEEALRIQRANFGPEHRQVVITEANLGAVMIGARHYADARKRLEDVLPVAVRVFGDKHRLVVNIIDNLAGAARGQKDYAAAIDYAKRGIELNIATVGRDHPETVTSLGNLAAIEADAGQFHQAVVDGNKALAALQHLVAPGSPKIAGLLLSIGDSEVHDHDPAAGLRNLDRARALFAALDDKRGLCDTDLSRADAKAALDDVAAGRTIAKAVLEHPADDDIRDQATKWLAEHP
ncbi:MAG TPA: serine/threonine-protein kinase, partial [Kofleriaceae bacterium]|nr:serine/threonine-protein kinase [Kofleriaceae bacterium]